MLIRGTIFFITVVLSTLCGSGSSQERRANEVSEEPDRHGRIYPPRIYTTMKLAAAPPVIDGRLDDDAWQEGEWAGDYKQQIPTEGAEPSQRTEIKILYDERNIYVAMRAYDDPSLVHRYGSRRDRFEGAGDIMGVCFDSYNDKRTGFEFDLSAGGGKIDLILMNEGWDTTWDAVWYGKTAMEPDAWTAEFQIPLSQLRYGPQDEQVWGLHAWRWIDRNQEEDQWNLIPRHSTGPMYNLGELHGIRGLRRFRHIELLPHTVARVTSHPAAVGNPYRQGLDQSASIGLDAKVGLTSNFTLDATVNPDFGQVEADPSVMNLTAYETFFPEKRPFFLEGKNIMRFDLGSGEGTDTLFYSRRIGRAPVYAPAVSDGEFLRSPEMTSILDAVKITGKTDQGLSIGVLQSTTSRETAEIAYRDQERRATVEPYSNYFLARIQKDWQKGNTSLGGIFTSTHRWLSDPALDFLPADAFTGGLDFAHYFRNRTYVLEGSSIFSQVTGSQEAIRNLQTNPVHYYQRPDATHLGVDDSATALSGHGGKVRFARTEKSRWRFSDTLRWSSPGLELNDLGYLRQADSLQNHATVGYNQSEPQGLFRSFDIALNRLDAWDFGGLKTEEITGVSGAATFKNKWYAFLALHAVQKDVTTRLLRGGPALARDRLWCWHGGGRTDPSRRASLFVGLHRHTFPGGHSSSSDLTPGITLRLSNSLLVSSELQYSDNVNDLEYVATALAGERPVYLLGRIHQKTVGTTFRVNLNLTRDLSIQYYGSPFVSSGNYSDFKRTAAPLAARYGDRFYRFAPAEISYREDLAAYQVNEAAETYSFGRPDFSFRQFRSNLVMRWEPKPGSSLYVVWAQGRTSQSSAWESSLGRNYSALWDAPSQNILLVKLSYWLPL
jgi:hypothetical protein